MSAFNKCPLITGKNILKTVGILEKCPDTTGVRWSVPAEGRFYCNKLLALQSNEEKKLNIYSRIKIHYKYETYLNLHPYNNIITKFKLSNHYLPIENGIYVKPTLNRNQRLCTFCKFHVGDELHVLFECEHGTIKNINTTYHNEITKIANQFHNLSNESKLNYILGATDNDIIPTTSEWLTKINQLFK